MKSIYFQKMIIYKNIYIFTNYENVMYVQVIYKLFTKYLQVFTSGSTRNLWFILLMYNLSLGMALLVPRLSDLLDSRHYVQLYTTIYKYIQYIQLCTSPIFYIYSYVQVQEQFFLMPSGSLTLSFLFI